MPPLSPRDLVGCRVRTERQQRWKARCRAERQERIVGVHAAPIAALVSGERDRNPRELHLVARSIDIAASLLRGVEQQRPDCDPEPFDPMRELHRRAGRARRGRPEPDTSRGTQSLRMDRPRLRGRFVDASQTPSRSATAAEHRGDAAARQAAACASKPRAPRRGAEHASRTTVGAVSRW